MSRLQTETAFIWNIYETFKSLTLHQAAKHKNVNRGPQIPRKQELSRSHPQTATQQISANVQHEDDGHLQRKTPVPFATKNISSHAEAVREGKKREEDLACLKSVHTKQRNIFINIFQKD